MSNKNGIEYLTAFAVVVHLGKVTLIRHHDRGWELPGDRVLKKTELNRELKVVIFEQTGLRVKQFKQIAFRELDTAYFLAEATALTATMPQSNQDIVEVALVSVEEALYLFRESAAEFGVQHTHQQVLKFCLQSKLLSPKPIQLSSTYILPSPPTDLYRLNISRSFSTLYKMVQSLDKGAGKRPYFENGDKRIYLSMSNR